MIFTKWWFSWYDIIFTIVANMNIYVEIIDLCDMYTNSWYIEGALFQLY